MLAHPSYQVDPDPDPNHAQYDGEQLRRTSDGVVIDRDDERRRITHIVVFPGVTVIYPEAFSRCTSLTSVTLPEGLKEIGEEAFSYCTSLTSIILPEGLFFLGGFAFLGCTSLSSVTLPWGLSTIGAETFRFCTSLSSILLPYGLNTIGWNAFEHCTSLSSVLVHDRLTTIEDSAFNGCTSLTSISIPETVPRVYTPTRYEGHDEYDEDDYQQNQSSGVAPTAFYGCTLLSQLSAAKSMDVEPFLRWRRRVPRQRYAVLASLARLRDELYARQAKRGRLAHDEAAEEEEEEEEELVLEEQAGVLRGALAFDIIHSDDLWRHILEFL